MNHADFSLYQFTTLRFASSTIALSLAFTLTAHAQPFENVLTAINPLPAMDFRAVTTIAVNPSATRVYAAAGAHPVPGNTSSFLHLSFWSETGSTHGPAGYYMPNSNGWFDLRSLSEGPNGDFVVGGYASDSVLGTRTFWARFDSAFSLKAAYLMGGSDTSDPRVKAILLSSGNILVMDPVNTGVSNRAKTRILCMSATGTLLWAREYTTANCETLRFADLRESANGLVYAAGYIQGAAGFPAACVMEIDPTPTTSDGLATGLWKYPASAGVWSEFTSIDTDNSGNFYAAGTNTWFAAPGPGFVTFLRAVCIRSSQSMASVSDCEYRIDMIPAFGSGRYVPGTSGGTWLTPPLFFIAGATSDGLTARHLRLDAFGLSFNAGADFKSTASGNTRFSGLTLGASQPAEAVMVGLLSTPSASTDQAYIVKTGPFGATSCSTAWSKSPVVLTPSFQTLNPVSLRSDRYCNGTPVGTVTSVAQISLRPHTFTATVVVKKKCDNCSSDFTGDAMVDDMDFIVFAEQYNTFLCSDPAMTPGCPADLTLDGAVDDSDFMVFVNAYNLLVCE